ncbi:tubulin epsilon and delta complex protein 1 [Notolabrus celidotus]|uniref:tubulin epsilon and delta complex protein 1 n=1 Tax=Notolabrus celidotus TaxID=1203425 RepID=UPI00148F9B27|nr:tubulin epsilon and delta complex protein 1 [Notolabrus celidotus]
MQRSKASVEVKQVIGSLCRLLTASGLEAVPAPETFRRAKFSGGPEVEDQFLQLLANILQTAGVVSHEAQAQLGGEPHKLVAAGLWQTGYHADWMFMEEEGDGGEGGRCSSRELLLALGWLLAAGTLETLVTQRVQKLDRTLFTPPPVSSGFSNKPQVDSSSLRRLQWLVGSLRHQGRILLSMQEERTRLLHAVFLASLSSSPPSSQQNSAALKEDCVCVRLLCDLLESYLNWKQAEKVFWTWMDSVLDCYLTDPMVIKKPTQTLRRSTRRVCHHGNRGLEEMEDMLRRLPTGQKGQRRSREAAADRGEGGQRKVLQSGSETSLPPFPSMHTFPQVYRARLQSAGPVKRSSRPADGGAEAADELPASQAARLLLQTEALLLERRDARRLTNGMQLQEIVSRRDELVLIPP